MAEYRLDKGRIVTSKGLDKGRILIHKRQDIHFKVIGKGRILIHQRQDTDWIKAGYPVARRGRAVKHPQDADSLECRPAGRRFFRFSCLIKSL